VWTGFGKAEARWCGSDVPSTTRWDALPPGKREEEEGPFDSGASHERLVCFLTFFFLFSKKRFFFFSRMGSFFQSPVKLRTEEGWEGSVVPHPFCVQHENVSLFDSGTSRSSKAGNDFVRALVLSEPHQIERRRGLESLVGAGSSVFR
jgi:hypothetical protein